MNKQVNIADLKSHLSEHLRLVRAGQPLIVMDRNTPIARIVPYDAGAGVLVIRKPRPGAPRIQDIPMPPPVKLDVDVAEVLREERDEDDEWG
jgi:prevent-host-death family protein